MKCIHGPVAAIASIGLFCASGVNAHVFGEHAGGLAAGAIHPLLGIDHLTAMVAIGLWAAQAQRVGTRASWLIPLAFLAAMSAGATIALTGIALPNVEAGVAS